MKSALKLSHRNNKISKKMLQFTERLILVRSHIINVYLVLVSCSTIFKLYISISFSCNQTFVRHSRFMSSYISLYQMKNKMFHITLISLFVLHSPVSSQSWMYCSFRSKIIRFSNFIWKAEISFNRNWASLILPDIEVDNKSCRAIYLIFPKYNILSKMSKNFQ